MNKKSQTTIYLSFFGQIEQATVSKFMETCNQALREHHPKELYILFASGGGSVSSEIILYTFLRSMPLPITMHNIGAIHSIANIVFLAGNKRYAAPHSTFLFHNVGTTFKTKSRLTLPEISERCSALYEDEKRIIEIFRQHTSLTPSEIRRFFRQGETKTAEYAQTKGLVEKIQMPKIPHGAAPITISTS